MKKIQEKIKDISHNYYKELLYLQNVYGVGLGFKRINGKKTNQLCLRILVENKIPSKYLSPNNIVPKNYMGIATDICCYENTFQSSKLIEIDDLLKDLNFNSKIRPLEGGYKIKSIGKSGSGTLGCIVTGKLNGQKEFFILSNSHVLAYDRGNRIPIGNSIVQPPDGNDNIVATLTTYIPIKAESEYSEISNYADCAIAKVLDKNLISDKVAIIGNLAGDSEAIIDSTVRKVGGASGLSTGKILSTFTTIRFASKALNGKSVIYKDCIETDFKSIGGDSGSVLVNEYNEVVGLIFSSGETTFANDIDHVLNNLNVDIYVSE